jgi:hypothetical protein
VDAGRLARRRARRPGPAPVARDGRVLAVLAVVPAVDGLFERESSWIHWVRRFTGAELMGKLLERDASRKGSAVRRVDVLSRGVSGARRRCA